MIALDGVLDRGYRLRGAQPARYRTPTLASEVNWASVESFVKPGVPPNGSDYVRLRKGSTFLRSTQIRSIAFDGSLAFPRRPVEWQVDPSPIDHAGNPALHSGSGGGLDRGIVRRVQVPQRARLTFATRYDLATGRDFGFVQVSTDGGKSWRSLPGNLTTTSADPTVAATTRRNLPGVTGRSGGGPLPIWTTANYDLSAYGGRSVLLAFRYVSDAAGRVPGLVDRRRPARQS